MRKKRYEWIISNDPLCDKPTTLVSQHSVPVTFVFSIYYGFMSECWMQDRRFETGWRFTCNIWFSNIACASSRSGKTTVSLLPYYNERGYRYFDRDHEVRASNPHYSTEAQCIEAALWHVAARLDTTLQHYPDIVYFLLRPECDPFFKFYQQLIEKEHWLNELRNRQADRPDHFVGLSEQLQLF